MYIQEHVDFSLVHFFQLGLKSEYFIPLPPKRRINIMTVMCAKLTSISFLGIKWEAEIELVVISILVVPNPKTPDKLSQQFHINF